MYNVSALFSDESPVSSPTVVDIKYCLWINEWNTKNRPNGSNCLKANKRYTIRKQLTKAWDVFISIVFTLSYGLAVHVWTALVHNFSFWKVGQIHSISNTRDKNKTKQNTTHTYCYLWRPYPETWERCTSRQISQLHKWLDSKILSPKKILFFKKSF